jgi:hypothetical protein
MSKKNKIPMTKEEFYEKRKFLLEGLNKYITENKYKGYDSEFVLRIKDILESYTHENRLDMKGVLGHIIVDQTPDFKDPLFNAISDFDYRIS